jgi:D-alanyl-D-alanine carboxypeptidase (penicillin-binding protein 5/6)
MKKIVCCLLSVLLLIGIINSSVATIEKVDAYYAEVFNDFTSSSYVLLEPESGEVLVSNNPNEKMPVASICKLMTSLITLEKLDSSEFKLTDCLVASEHACSMEGSQAFLDVGSSYSVSDLLKSVIVASANDSAVVLAEAISGNENAFVIEMNKRAKELGMNNTVYANATGLPSPNQYSTAMDTSLILREIVKHKLFVDYSNIWMDTLVHASGRETELVNTNRLIKYYPNCKAGKTGFTDEAGYCLVSMATNENLNLIAVTLNCDKPQDRFKESMDLFNYGFANFENKQLLDSSVLLPEKIKVNGGKQNLACCKFAKDFYVVSKKGDVKNYSVEIDLVNSICAPKVENDVVGKATVVNNGKVISEIPVILAETLEKQSYADILNKMASKWAIK